MLEGQKVLYLKELHDDIFDIIEIIYASESYKKDIKEKVEIMLGNIPKDTKGAVSHLRVLTKLLLHGMESNRREIAFFRKMLNRHKGEDFLQSD